MTGRERLAARQAQLVGALLAGEPAPPGFDPERVRIEAAALHAKRRRTTERLRPDLVDRLGGRFAGLFDEWARTRPLRVGVSFWDDADAFAAWVDRV